MKYKLSAGNIAVVLLFMLSFTTIPTKGQAVSSSDNGTQVYTELAAKNSDSRLAGPLMLGGKVIAVSLDGSEPFVVNRISRAVFAKEKPSVVSGFQISIDAAQISSISRQLNNFFAGGQSPINGTIYLLGRNGNVKEIVEFFDAHISSFTMPAFDASDDGTTRHFFTVKFTKCRLEPIDSTKLKQTVKPVNKKWQNSSFKFELGSLPCDRVTKIDSFTVKQGVNSSRPAQLEIPNLKIYISTADVPAWQDWYRDFVIQGNCDPQEGRITLLGSDGRKKLAVFSLSNVCPVSIHKHLATIKYEDITVEIGMGMSR